MSKRFFGLLQGALLLGGVAILGFACSKVDDTLGSGLIPSNQQVHLAQVEVTGINAFLVREDSIPVSYINLGYIGSTQDPIFGTTQTGWVAQFAPYFHPQIKDFTQLSFKANPTVDSLVLNLQFVKPYSLGDLSKKQTFNIYRLTHRFKKDQLYYSNMNMAGLYDPQPIFSFDYTYQGTGRLRLQLQGPEVDLLITQLLDESRAKYEKGNSSVFVDDIRGIYIAPASSSAPDAATLAVELNTSYMSLWTHHAVDPINKPGHDSIVVANYKFHDDLLPLVTFNTYDLDYSGTPLASVVFNDTLSTSQPVALGYIHGSSGVSTYLRFTEAFVNELKAKIAPSYKSMTILKATLELDIHNPSIAVLDRSIMRLGSYRHYSKVLPISDYLYWEETKQNPVQLPYGGYLNRGRNCYTLDLSRYLQEMVSASTTRSWTMMLGPSFPTDFYSQRGVVLNTGVTPQHPTPLSVRVTYTLMK